MWCRIIMLDNILAMNREKTNTLQKTYEGTFPIYVNQDHVRNDQTRFPTECQFVKWNRLKITGHFTQA